MVLKFFVCVYFLVRGLLELLCSELQWGVPLLLDVAQQSCGQSGIRHCWAVNPQAADVHTLF